MSADSATLAARALAESLMESVCEVRRAVGVSRDPDSGVDEPVYDDVWSGPCRFRFPFVRPSDQDVASQVLSTQRGIVSVPIDGTDVIRTGDVVFITVSPLDAAMLGAQFRVKGPFFETHATARRLPVEVVS